MDKRYEHTTCELTARQKWESEQTYTTHNNPGPLYSIDTPPPTVSGSLHIGHLFSYTQTDIIARYKRMNGFSVFYPFGFDDNGLPTERYVEKKKKINAHDLGRSKFIKLCLQETHEVEQQFKILWQRMGLSVDWAMNYSTISDNTRKLAQESFIVLYKKKFIYRKYEPALYCTNCRTSVAQAELDDAKQDSFFNDIIFQDAQGNDLIIGTTRPELLPSCVALFYNPHDERYQHLKGTLATVPLFNFTVPIYADEHVEIEKGTGLVMCCTFGDKTDITWFKKFNLPYKQSIGFNGKFTNNTALIAGLTIKDARTKIIEHLKEKNLLIRQQPISHTVNLHERCKKEIEYIALEQWFLNLLDHKQSFLDCASQIAWYPSFMKARYNDWVTNLSWDWCLSRQRFYGIPFPVWHCCDCHTIILANTDELPLDPQERAPSSPCSQCNGTNLAPDTDVMDTWNTSSITPYILAYLKDPSHSPILMDQTPPFLPMSMRPQAHDIIRTWAFYTLVKTWMHHRTIPWKEIVLSGHVLSDSSEKLSKSKDSGKLAPETLLAQYPADVIRYWTASGSLGHDVAFSENQLKIGQRLITKLWNAFRFIQEHSKPADHNQQPSHFGIINEWILHRASQTFDSYKKQFEAHEFGAALAAVEPFFWNDFCDNYLELIKHQLFNPHEYSPQQINSTQWTLHHVGLRILQLYAPYMPYITETLYGLMYQQTSSINSIHQTKFSTVQQEYLFDSSTQQTELLITLIATVRKLKTEKQLSLKTTLACLTIHTATQASLETLKKESQTIGGITQAQQIDFSLSSATSSSLTQTNDVWYAEVYV